MQITTTLQKVTTSFIEGWNSGGRTPRVHCIRHDKKMREDMAEEGLDDMLMDSFPASDPVARY